MAGRTLYIVKVRCPNDKVKVGFVNNGPDGRLTDTFYYASDKVPRAFIHIGFLAFFAGSISTGFLRGNSTID